MQNSTYNIENLILSITENLKRKKSTQILYTTIINRVALKLVTEYSNYEKLTDQDAINHHGKVNILVTKKYKYWQQNLAHAYKNLRYILPYSTAKFCVEHPESDILFNKIDHFNWQFNSFFYSQYNTTED